MKKGMVKWFSGEKGYGFIQSDNTDYFVHYKEIKAEGFKNLNPGESVIFEAERADRGPIAKNVKRLDV